MKRGAQMRRIAVVLATLMAAGSAAASDFVVVGLPDTQNYAQFYPATYHAQTQWIVDNIAPLNIRFVTHLGDVVNIGTDPAELYQWQTARAAHDKLDNIDFPNGVCVGNHDIWGTEGGGFTGEGYDPAGTYFLQHFGSQYYAGNSWYVGASPSGLSSCQIINVDGFALLFLHICVETPAAELAWAQGILNANRDKPTFVSTHRYLYSWGPLGAGRYQDWNYVFEPLYRHDGIKAEEFFNNFVRPNKQIFAVMCGHNAGEYRQVSTNLYGLPVHEILVDYQEFYGEGGNGYLRIMKFRPSAKVIEVQSYSPTLNAYLTGSESQFTLGVDFAAYTTADPLLRFQEGVSGYSGTQDTWVNEDAKNSSYGSSSIIRVDDDTANSIFTDYKGHGLLRFDSLFQGAVKEGDPAPTRIPLGAAIQSATLSLNLLDDTDLGDPEYYVYRMTTGWSEGSTWNSLGGDGVTVGIDTTPQVVATFLGDNNPNLDYFRVFSVKSAVEAWSAGATNLGLAIIPQPLDFNDEGIDIRSSEDGDVSLRPALDVAFSYTVQNAPPVVTQPLQASALSVDEGAAVTFTIAAADPNPLDPLVFKLNGFDIGYATGGATVEHEIVFADDGPYFFVAQVADDEALVSGGMVSLQVNNVAPTITSLTGDLSVSVGESFAFFAQASDPGVNDVLTTVWDLDADGAFDDYTGANGVWTYATPGLRTVKVAVTDGDGGLTLGQFLVDVSAAPCPADLDGDGSVGQADLNIVLASFESGPGGDLDGDGDTDQADLNLLLAAFDTTCP